MIKPAGGVVRARKGEELRINYSHLLNTNTKQITSLSNKIPYQIDIAVYENTNKFTLACRTLRPQLGCRFGRIARSRSLAVC